MNKRTFLRVLRLVFTFVLLVGLLVPARPARAAMVTSVLVFPSLLINSPYPYRSELQLFNPGVTAADVSIDFVSSSGGAFTWMAQIGPYAARRVTAADLTGLPAGTSYTAVVSATQPVEGVAVLYHLGSAPQTPDRLLSLYPGQSTSQAAAKLYFGPVYRNSGLTLVNAGTAVADLTVSLYPSAGGAPITLVRPALPPYGSYSYNLATEPTVPAGFSGMAVVTATQPLVGILQNRDATLPSGLVNQTLLPLQPNFNQVAAARMLRSVNDYGGPRTSKIFYANVTPNTAYFSAAYYHNNGSLALSETPASLPAGASRVESLASTTLPQMWSGGLVFSSDQPVAFADVTDFDSLPTDTTAAFYSAPAPATFLALPRLVNTADRRSIISLMNPGVSPAAATLTIYNLDGTGAIIRPLTLPPNASTRIDLASLALQPDGFEGAATLTADQPVTYTVDEFYTYTPPCQAPILSLTRTPADPIYTDTAVTFSAAVTGSEPLTYTWVLDGMGIPLTPGLTAYSTSLAAGQHTFSVSVSNACGSDSATENVSVTAYQDPLAPQVTLSRAPSGTITSNDALKVTASVSGLAPFGYAWTYDGQPIGNGTDVLNVSPLAVGPHTVAVTVTNTHGSASGSLNFTVETPACSIPRVYMNHTPQGTLYAGTPIHFDNVVMGTAPFTYVWTLDGITQATTAATFDATLSQGSHIIAVDVTNACGTDSQYMVLDIQPEPCYPVTLNLAQSPAGVIFPTDLINFTASAAGTPPFTFTWEVDGAPAGTNSPIYTTSLPLGNHYVTVTAANRCTAGYAFTRAFTVVAPPVQVADLSMSTLNASLNSVQTGQPVQYVAVLRNTGGAAAPGAQFSAPIPSGTDYIPGSAAASDGRPVTYASGALSWTGDLKPGSPVMIRYELKVTDQSSSARQITATAAVTDNAAKQTNLIETVRYQPGYTLQINGGALAANSLSVDLSFTYDTGYGLVRYQLSNTAAFDAEGSATGWLDLAPGQTTHPAWQLNALGDPRQPRMVYIRYQTAADEVVGPFMAAILLDQQPPDEPKLETQPAAGLLRFSGISTAAIPSYTVTTADDNSGVGWLEVSTRPDFSSRVSRMPVTGPTTTFAYRQSEPGPIYVRAVDRSGNTSAALELQGYNFIFLPLTRR